MPNVRQCIKKVIKPSLRCKLLDSKGFNTPELAPLPDFHVIETPSFSQVGIDYAGPLFFKLMVKYLRQTFAYSQVRLSEPYS